MALKERVCFLSQYALRWCFVFIWDSSHNWNSFQCHAGICKTDTQAAISKVIVIQGTRF